MRSLPDDFDPACVDAIDARLAEVARDHGVRVLWAIESGSRAWGFPSPDSDYDCRFFYLRPAGSYVDPWPPRDVIETPLEGLIDANGWDLIKAVRLATEGNAVVGEWLRSPYVYLGEEAFRDDLLVLVDQVADRDGIRRHYLHVGRQHWLRAGHGDDQSVVLKRLFYAIRPALALVWLEGHPDQATPPMRLDELMAEAPPPTEVQRHIAALVEAKRHTRELGRGQVPPPLAAWLVETFSRHDVEPRHHDRGRAKQHAREGFRRLVDTWAPRA